MTEHVPGLHGTATKADSTQRTGTATEPAAAAAEGTAKVSAYWLRLNAENDAYMERAKAFPAAKRDQLAKKGHALPDGSFPIETPGDVDSAIQAFGRAASKPAAKAHIKKRAAALGVSHKLPDGWKK